MQDRNNADKLASIYGKYLSKSDFDFSDGEGEKHISEAQELLKILEQQNEKYAIQNASIASAFKEEKQITAQEEKRNKLAENLESSLDRIKTSYSSIGSDGYLSDDYILGGEFKQTSISDIYSNLKNGILNGNSLSGLEIVKKQIQSFATAIKEAQNLNKQSSKEKQASAVNFNNLKKQMFSSIKSTPSILSTAQQQGNINSEDYADLEKKIKDLNSLYDEINDENFATKAYDYQEAKINEAKELLEIINHQNEALQRQNALNKQSSKKQQTSTVTQKQLSDLEKKANNKITTALSVNNGGNGTDSNLTKAIEDLQTALSLARSEKKEITEVFNILKNELDIVEQLTTAKRQQNILDAASNKSAKESEALEKRRLQTKENLLKIIQSYTDFNSKNYISNPDDVGLTEASHDLNNLITNANDNTELDMVDLYLLYFKNQVNDIVKENNQTKKYEAELKKQLTIAENIDKNSSKYITSFQNQIKETISNINSLIRDKLFTEKNVADTTKSVSDLKDGSKSKSNKTGNPQALLKLQAKTQQVLSYTALPSSILQSAQDYYDKLVAINKQGDYSEETVNNLATEYNKLNVLVEASGKKTLSFFDKLKSAATQQTAQTLAMYFSFNDWIRYAQMAVQAVEELDSALTELKVVSNATSEELSNVSAQAFKIANSLGATTADVVGSITDWRRLGYTIEESMSLAQQASTLSTGGLMEVDVATEALTSALQAYDELDVSNISSAVDQFIYLGNNYAITSEELATSLENSSAALVAAGNSFEQAEALEIAGNSTLQDADQISNALKVVAMRIRGTSASELEALGEDTDGLIEDASKLNAEIKSLTKTQDNPKGISIIDETTNAYKSTYEILKDISDVWDELSDANQSALLEDLAGKTRGSAVAAILSNGDILESAYDDAMNNSVGAGAEALENSLDSIEKKITKFTNQLNKLFTDIIDSNAIKDIVDLGTVIISLIDKVVGKIGLLGTTIAGLGIGTVVDSIKTSLKTNVLNTDGVSAATAGLEAYDKTLRELSGDLVDVEKNKFKANNLSDIELAGYKTDKSYAGTAARELLAENAALAENTNETVQNTTAKTTEQEARDADANAALLEANGVVTETEAEAGNTVVSNSNTTAKITEQEARDANANAALLEANGVVTETEAETGNTSATTARIVASKAATSASIKQAFQNLTESLTWENLSAAIAATTSEMLVMLATNPITYIAGLILIIKGLSYAYDKATISTEEAAEGAEKLADSVKTLKKETSENLSTISDLNKRYQELSKGVNSVGENVSLTTAKYEEYKDIMSQVAEIMPDLNYYYNEQGEAIGFVGEQIDNLSKKYKEVALKAAKTQLAERDDENHLLTTESEQNYNNFSTGKDVKLGREDQGMSYQDALDELKKGYEAGDKLRRQELEYYVKSVTGENIKTIKNADDESFGIMIDNTIDILEADLASRFSEFKDGYITNQILANESYWKLDDDVRGNIDKLVSSLSNETWEMLKAKSGESDVGNITQWLIDQFSDKNLQQAWTDLTNLDLSDVQFGDIDSTLQEKAKTVFETLGLDWDNGGYDLLVSLNLVPDETNYNALKEMLGENGDLADDLTVGQIDTLTSDDFQEWAKDAEVSISKVAGSYRNEMIDAAQEVLDEERQKAKDWSEEVPGLYEKVYDEQGNYILKQSQFGNVDMDKREIITWTRELKKQYADALASWDYDPEIGSIDTVFGSWDEFGDESLPISFTPILVDENGKNAQLLDFNTVHDYINNLVEQSTKNGKIDTDLLLQLDANRENGGWGLISGVGDEAEMISYLTHFAGLFGGVQIAMQDMQDAASDDGWAKKLVNAYKIAQKGTEKLSDSLSDITTKMDGLSSLGDIYEDVQDGGEFDYSSIADTSGDFYAAFGNLGQPYEDFLQTVADSPSNISKCQQAFNNLATTWVYANGVLDDLDNTNKQATANMLKQNGIQNATEMVNAYISAANTYTQAYNSLDGATDKAISLADATWEDIETMAQVPEVTQEAADAMYIYYIQKLMASSGFTSASDIQELANVIQALGIAGTAWGKYYSARANYQALSNVDLSDGESKTVSLVNLKTGKAYEKEIKSQKQLNHYLEYQNNIMNSNKSEGLDQMAQRVGNLGAKVKKTADDTSSDAKDKADEIEDAYENLLDAETTVLEKQLDAQLITYSDYLDKRLALLEDYHNKGLISEEKYYEGLADTYQSEIDNYDKVISAVDKVIDDKVKALEKQKDALEDANDAQVKALEKQQKALENSKKLLEDQQDDIDKQKEALEDQKEALEDANQAREDAIELQKALYDLEKAQTQRTRLIYNNGQMVYRSDASSIRDAQDNLDDITYEKKVDAIEDAIDALDDQIDALDDEIDALDDEIDKLDDEIDELNDALDLQTDAIDKQIDALNDYKDKWDEIANAWQDAQDIAMANQILGDNWQNQVLALDTTPIENFKNTYVDAQNQMALANEMAAEAAVTAAQKELAAAQSSSSGTQNAVAGATNSFTRFTDSLVGDGGSSSGGKAIGWSSTGYIGTTLDGKKLTGNPFSDYKTLHSENNNSGTKQFGTSTSVTGASSEASDAVDGMNNSISNTSSVVPDVQSSLSALTSSLNNEVGGYAKSTSAIKANTEARLGNLAAMQKEAEADALRQKINSRGYSITTPTTSGIACATGSSGLKTTQQALTSEYGQAEMIVTPDGHWQVTTEPTLQNLPKGTVIYDGDQTEQLLKGNAYSTGTGATITPLAEADSEKFKMFSDVSAMLVNTNSINVGLKDISKSLAQISAEVTPRTQSNNNDTQQVTFGNIIVNCPGVTEAEVAKNLPNALQNAFSGLALNAYQQSMKR